MVDTAIVERINSVVEKYFANNTSLNIVPVKELMPSFKSAGIFAKDIRKGLPIRKILRELDEANELKLIPFIYAERTEKSTYWYFIPSGAGKPSTPYKQEESKVEPKPKKLLCVKNDEAYVIDLCDTVLGQKAIRQKKFDFLEGDLHKNGKTKTKLPVDAFYHDLDLAIQFKEEMRAKPDSKKQLKPTVSGMPRSEQRLRYEQRIAKVLPANGITLVDIQKTSFKCDDHNKIIRNEENDMRIVKKALSKFIK